MNVCPICSSEIEDESVRQICQSCGNGDRTRSLYLMYDQISPLTVKENALVFTTENWLPDRFFGRVERSVYGGSNHLDIQAIARIDGAYSWVASNHVLEHVSNDRSALLELFRIISDNGIIQLTVPTPSRVYSTKDWGFADPTRMGHFRNYGAEFTDLIREVLPNSHILAIYLEDSISPFRDITYLLAKNRNQIQIYGDFLLKTGRVCVPFSFFS